MTSARPAPWLLLLAPLAACAGGAAPAPAPRPVTACGVAPFDDVTASLGVDFVHHLPGGYCSAVDFLGSGACMIDYDGDGDEDLYFVDRAPHPNRLYRNDGARFADVTRASGAGDTRDGLGCLAVDYDGDGDQDLYLTNLDGDRLYRNDRGRFADVSVDAGVRTEGVTTSATAGDVDGDGDNDLVVARFVDPASLPRGCVYRVNEGPGLTNLLLVNRGGRFTEEGAARGLTDRDPTLAVKLYDLDGDGDLDLYAGNDFGRSYPDRLYLNDGRGRFADGARAMGLDADAAGGSGDTMGVALGDVDGDGAPELVSSSSTGDDLKLYHCDRALHCAEASASWGLGPSAPMFKWAVGLEDFDLDGDLDLFVANSQGYAPWGQRNAVFWNVGGRFVEHATADDEALASVQSSRAAVLGDLDGDGAVDAVVSNVGARPQVLRNRAGCGHWLAVRVVPPVAGARVRVTAGGRALERQLSLGGSYLGSDGASLHFGLGAASSASVEVRWPGGRVVRRDGVTIDAVLTVR